MKTVFEPSNALEGHMLQDLLKQRGISAHVEGAQLQGGVGELPVTGFVRVVVGDDDYDAARAIIDEWEAANVSEPIPIPSDRTTKGFIAGLIGMAIGIAVTYAFLRAPVNSEQLDQNEDGKFDEHLSFSPLGVLLKVESDRNYDGKIDLIQQIDRKGRTDTVVSDEDFSGSLESRWYYRANQPVLGEIDMDGDSTIDIRTQFTDGVVSPRSTWSRVRDARCAWSTIVSASSRQRTSTRTGTDAWTSDTNTPILRKSSGPRPFRPPTEPEPREQQSEQQQNFRDARWAAASAG